MLLDGIVRRLDKHRRALLVADALQNGQDGTLIEHLGSAAHPPASLHAGMLPDQLNQTLPQVLKSRTGCASALYVLQTVLLCGASRAASASNDSADATAATHGQCVRDPAEGFCFATWRYR